MVSWRTRRQLVYFVPIFGLLVIMGLLSLYSAIHTAPTCTDKKQNQGEVGIDCGGPCAYLCLSQVSPLQVVWAKAFPVSSGVYDLGAFIKNPNRDAGLPRVSYTVKVSDSTGNTLVEKKGSTYVNAGEDFPIFIPNVPLSDAPKKTEVIFDVAPWSIAYQVDSGITVKNKKFISPDLAPSLSATLSNKTFTEKRDLSAYGIIYDTSHNVRAMSSTYVSSIPSGQGQDINFTWPEPVTLHARGALCTAPVDTMLVFDRSGSMTSDGKNPPEPLTSAKDAAKQFVAGMQTGDKVGLESFATTGSTPPDQTLTGDNLVIDQAIDQIIIHTDGTQYTNLGDAINNAVSELDSDTNKGTKKAIIILTDGIASRPLDPADPSNDAYAEEYAVKAATAADKEGVIIYVIGLGKDVNKPFLSEQIATDTDHYYEALTSSDLKAIYVKIAQVVCAEEAFLTEIDVRGPKFVRQ